MDIIVRGRPAAATNNARSDPVSAHDGKLQKYNALHPVHALSYLGPDRSTTLCIGAWVPKAAGRALGQRAACAARNNHFATAAMLLAL